MNQHERGTGSSGDEAGSDSRLSPTGRRAQHAGLRRQHGIHCALLRVVEVALELDRERLSVEPLILNVEAHVKVGEQRLYLG